MYGGMSRYQGTEAGSAYNTDVGYTSRRSYTLQMESYGRLREQFQARNKPYGQYSTN